jgi:hypothetical protein
MFYECIDVMLQFESHLNQILNFQVAVLCPCEFEKKNSLLGTINITFLVKWETYISEHISRCSFPMLFIHAGILFGSDF